MSAILCIVAMISTSQNDKPVIHLWPNGAPGSESRQKEAETKPNPWSVGNIYNPSLTVYQPILGTANGTAVIVVPGGGHRELVVGEEGHKPAEFMSKLGITAFVLKHRLAREKDSGLTVEKDARADGYRAVRLVRSRAKEWNLNPYRIGMMGFSAGGEVLSMAAFQGGPGDSASPDLIDRLDAKPNFGIWIYPGPLGIPAEVPANSPPAFVLVANDDGSANVCLDLV
ncbi:MAG: alpha/beta hydrolase, partial [Chlorobia bacterium]|nr:alpha/beta hydrolase [Fimbriimonadaceae bacterium]